MSHRQRKIEALPLNNIHLVHQIAQQVRAGQMPRGRIRVIEGTRYDGRPVVQLNYTHEAMRGHMSPTERACRGLIIDPSDITKKYAKKMQYLDTVRDGTEGGLSIG